MAMTSWSSAARPLTRNMTWWMRPSRCVPSSRNISRFCLVGRSAHGLQAGCDLNGPLRSQKCLLLDAMIVRCGFLSSLIPVDPISSRADASRQQETCRARAGAPRLRSLFPVGGTRVGVSVHEVSTNRVLCLCLRLSRACRHGFSDCDGIRHTPLLLAGVAPGFTPWWSFPEREGTFASSGQEARLVFRNGSKRQLDESYVHHRAF